MKKKILSIILSAMVLMGTVAFSACGNCYKIAELQEKIVELEERLELREETIKSYTKGHKMSLETAYKLGLLTKNDLLSIAYYCNYNSNFGNEEIMTEDYVPQPKNPEVLSEELDLKIREVCARNTNKTADDYYIYGYFGVYSNCVVVKTSIKADWAQVGREREIDGIGTRCHLIARHHATESAGEHIAVGVGVRGVSTLLGTLLTV